MASGEAGVEPRADEEKIDEEKRRLMIMTVDTVRKHATLAMELMCEKARNDEHTSDIHRRIKAGRQTNSELNDGEENECRGNWDASESDAVVRGKA